MNWYRDLVDLLKEDDSHTQKLRSGLEDCIVRLYKQLLIYQMKSVCRYNRREIYVFFRDMVKLDDWEGKLTNVKEAENDVQSKLEEYQSVSIRESIRGLAGAMGKQFNELAIAIQEQTRAQQNAQDRSKRQDYLRALRQMVDPHDEKERIQDEKGDLLRDCYSWILGHPRFTEWHQDRSTKKILWITGDPGKGKTMLLCGIIDELEKKPTNILSYFFCQATQETLSNATAVLRGLIYGLAKTYPQLDRHISEKYENGGGAAAFVGGTAWVVMRNILKAMLSDPRMDGVILVVDALDECVEGRQKLLEFICESSGAADSRAKWIVSSRNWLDIEKGMGKVMKNTSKLSLELNDCLVSNAVRKYVEQKVADLATEPPFEDNWDLCDKVSDCLNKNSGNTFLWVALVCDALRGGNVLEERHVSGPNGILDEFPGGLNNLYGRMLENIESNTRSSDKELCKHVLAVTSVMKRHVSLQELCSIMASSDHFDGEPKTLESLVRCCGSFLNIRMGIIHFVHQSAVEFLHEEALKEIFPLGIKATHRDVFVSSIKATSKVVCRNIYGLRDSDGREAPGLRRDEITTPQPDPLVPIQYASTYWIEHLSELGTPIHIDDHKVINPFLQNKFLYWIETLSLLNQLSQAIKGIQKLQKLVASRKTTPGARMSSSQLRVGQAVIENPDEEGISEFLDDANRFLLYHRVMIENTPLQLYASALMFSPEQSIVKKQFLFEAPDWVTVTHGMNAKWDTCLQTLLGHRSDVVSVAYSPDGQWLVSGDSKGTVKLWDVDSGTCVHTLDYHEENSVEYGESSDRTKRARVTSVAFSADGKSFVSAYESGLVKAFDRERGDCIREISALVHSEDAIGSWSFNWTAISKDGHTVARYLGGKSISMLRMDMEIPPRSFSPPQITGFAVTLTADGRFLASACGSGSGIIEIWNTLTGRSMQIIRTNELVKELIFSADGRWLATGGLLGVVRVWESTTGQLSLTLKDDMEERLDCVVGSLAFSDDKNLIAGFYGRRICVWNTTTSALAWKSETDWGNIFSLSFSPDALHLVSGSHDAIKVWDLPKSLNVDNISNNRFTQGLCCSDGLHFASYYPVVQEIEIWTGTNENDLAVMKCYENDVSVIALSPDHRSLASASSKGEITVWDTETGEPKRKFGDHRELASRITSMVFRGNTQLASGGRGVVNIRDTSDGRHKQTLGGYDKKCRYIEPMIFSVCGQWLAYRSYEYSPDHKVRVWDTEKEQCFLVSIATPLETAGCIDSFSFSADSQVLALGSKHSIYLWDMTSRNCTRVFRMCELDNHLQVWFDANVQRRLHTQYGFLDFIFQDPDCINARDLEDNRTYSKDLKDEIEILLDENSSTEWPSFGGYGFSYDLGWFTKGQRRLFQIPFDYQTSDSWSRMTPFVSGSTLIWISKTGRLLRVHLRARA